MDTSWDDFRFGDKTFAEAKIESDSESGRSVVKSICGVCDMTLANDSILWRNKIELNYYHMPDNRILYGFITG